MNISKIKTIEELESYRASINEECDKRKKEIIILSKASELSSKPFGYIKECFEAISPMLFENIDGRDVLRKYIATIKNNKNLSSLHNLYESVRKAGKNTDMDFFVGEISNTNWVDTKTLNEDVKSLGRVLSEGYIIVARENDVTLPKENKKLDTVLEYVATNKIGKKNIAEFSNAVSIIKENIANKENGENIFEEKNLDELAKELTEEFNKKYSDTFTDDEIVALKEIASSENRENIFEKYKKTCIDKINEAKSNFESKGEDDSVKRLEGVLEQISKKKYCVETAGSDLCNLIELSNIF